MTTVICPLVELFKTCSRPVQKLFRTMPWYMYSVNAEEEAMAEFGLVNEEPPTALLHVDYFEHPPHETPLCEGWNHTRVLYSV